MKKIFAVLMCVALLLTCFSVNVLCDEEEAAVRFSTALGNDMVLQRDKEINVWGRSTKKGEDVTVTFKGTSVTAKVDDYGYWKATLPAQPADKNENELTATVGGETATLTGILVGDVYFVGGQSNAEKTLGACGTQYKKDELNALIERDNNLIRYFQQSRSDVVSGKYKYYMDSPQNEPVPKKKWKKENLNAAREFSAIGFFFAHKMAEQLDVPIGMVMVASSGSPLSQLMSKEASQKTNYTKFENNIPVSGMYNGLMHPFINMTIKGMIFYQGESEMGLAVSDYGKYNEYLKAYVEDLREKMGQNFPFYYVQMSSHDGDGLTNWPYQAPQRAVQFDGVKMLENAGMVVSMDMGYLVGQSDWAHPDRKQPVGERLAALALCRDYGIGDEEYVTSPFPEYALKTDDGIVVHFTHVAGGLKKLGSFEKLTGFKAVLVNGTYRDVEAEIINENEVLVKTNEFSGILKGVGYGLEVLAFTEYDGDSKYIANLGNGSELPAPTFKITELLDAPPADATPQPSDDGTVTDAPDGKNDTKTNGGNTAVIIAAAVGAVIVIAAVVFIIIASKKGKKENN